MQTFAPYGTDFAANAAVLDMRRLGKQRVEGYQILRALTGGSHGWRHHPATKMWQDNISGLCAYTVSMCNEWTRRGYKDTCKDKVEAIVTPDWTDIPSWWGVEGIHLSHRSNLIRKDSVFYGALWPHTPNDLPYVWPVTSTL